MPNPFNTYTLNMWSIFSNEPELIFFTQMVSLILNTNTQLNVKTVLFQTIKFGIHTQFFVYTLLNLKTVLF